MTLMRLAGAPALAAGHSSWRFLRLRSGIRISMSSLSISRRNFLSMTSINLPISSSFLHKTLWSSPA
jgi:hypothetical protein